MNRTYLKDVAVRKRLFWMEQAERLGVNQACLKLGIYKSHFYYWKRRFKKEGIEGLVSRSRRPKRCPRLSRKGLVRKVLELRKETHRGADTIALLLKKRFGLQIPRSTVHKILRREGQVQKREKPPKKKHPLRYQASKPGDRVQIDVKYVPYRIREGTYGRAYQYTAIDDCTRARFAFIYDGHGILQLEDFLNRLREFFPFPIKLIQTDNHVIFTYKFTAHKLAFRKKPKVHFLETFCKQHRIRHHLIEPGEPALNGKVERSHRTDQQSFYDRYRFDRLEPLQQNFIRWIDYYNYERPHWGIKGMTPAEKLATFGYKLRRIHHDKIKTYSLAA
jgi:transposase InsO family protein